MGYYPCRKCNVCLHNVCGRRKSDTFESMVTQCIYSMEHFTTCATKFVVYLLTCPCNKQYIGRTIRTFSIRVNEHLTNIKSKTNHTVPRHYLEHHDRDPTGDKICLYRQVYSTLEGWISYLWSISPWDLLDFPAQDLLTLWPKCRVGYQFVH